MVTAVETAYKTTAEMIRQNFVGQKVGIICARYHYWGVVSDVTDDPHNPLLTLTDAVAVQQAGGNERDTPESQDPIHGAVHIMVNAIEIIHQVKWTQGALPGEA